MIDLTVKTLDSQNHAFNVDENITVAQFKQKVLEKISIPVETQRIIYCGRVLKDEHKLSEYDLNGKVVHLVQRAPPSAGGPSNSNTGQRRSRSISPSAQHRRRTPGGNTMYVGSMSFPANFVEGFIPPPPPPTHTLAASRLNVSRRMLSLAEARLTSPGDPTTATPSSDSAEETGNRGADINPVPEGSVIEMQIVSGGIEQAIDWFENLENDYMDEAESIRPTRSSTPNQPSTNQSSSVEQTPSNNQPPQIEDDDIEDHDQHLQHGHHVVDVVEVAFLDDHEPDHVEIVVGPEPSIPAASSVDTDVDTNMVDQLETETAPNVETQAEAARNVNSDSLTAGATETSNSSSAPRAGSADSSTRSANANQNPAAGSNICRTSAMATHLDTLQRIHQNFAPLLERYHQFMRDDPVIAPEDVDSTQTMLEQVSDILHLLGHAYHSLSDIIVRAYATPPRALLCCPILVHSGVMHSSLPLPIQLEAQINFNHSGNGTNGARNGMNNNNAAAAGQQGAAAAQQSGQPAGTPQPGHHTTTRIGIPIDANALTAQLAPILASVAAAVQQQQQAQSQQGGNVATPATTASSTTANNTVPAARVTGVYATAAGGGSGGNSRAPVYRMQTGGNGGLNGLSNVEYSIELLDDLPVDSELDEPQTEGQVNSSVATAATETASSSASTSSSSSSSSSTTAATAVTTGTAATASGTTTPGNNGGGQNSQARGNTATNPTTTQATRTRSTPRPHVHLTTEHAAAAALNNLFGGHGHGEPLFDPYLRCSSHHLHHQRSTTNNNNATGAARAGEQNRSAGMAPGGPGPVGGPVLAAGHVQVQMHGPRRLGSQGGPRPRVRGQTGQSTASAAAQQQRQASAPGSTTSSPSHQRQTAAGAQPVPPLPPGISLPPAMNAAIYQMAQGLMDNIQTVFAGAGSPPAPAQPEAQATNATNTAGLTTGPTAGRATGPQSQSATAQPDWLRGLLDTFSAGVERGAAANAGNAGNQQGRGEGVEGSVPVPVLISQAVGQMVRDLQGGSGPPSGASIHIDQGGVRLSDMFGLFQQQSPTRNPQQQQQQQQQPRQQQTGSVIDSFYTLIRRNLTLQDIFSLSTGNLDILQRFRGDIRSLVLTQLLNNSTTPEAIDRGVNIVLNDLRPYLDELTFMTPTEGIYMEASVTSLLRARLPNILQLAASPRTDNPRVLADQLRTTMEQLVALVIHVNADGVPGLERFIEHYVNQILRNFPETFRSTTLQDLHQRFVAPFTAQAASVPDSLLQPYLVRTNNATAAVNSDDTTTTAAAVATAQRQQTPAKEGPSNKDRKVTVSPTKQTVEAMDVDDELPEGAFGGQRRERARANFRPSNDSEEEEDRIIDSMCSGQDLWQNQLPPDWVPIITRDVTRQQQSTRRPSDSNTLSNVHSQSALSDAYLSGMPSKRRKIVTDAKPQLHRSPSNQQNGNTNNGHSSSNSLQLQRVISDGVRRAVSQTVVGQRGNGVEMVSEEIGGDAGVQAAYRDLVRASVAASVRGNVDLTEDRFPNACKYFMPSSEVNKPNVP